MKLQQILLPLFILLSGCIYAQTNTIPVVNQSILVVEPLKQEPEIQYPKDIKKINLKEYPAKEKHQVTKCIMNNKVDIPKVTAIIKEEDYNEKDE